MSSFFPCFQVSTLHSIAYEYKPIEVFAKAILDFKNEFNSDSHSELLIKKAVSLLNNCISAKPLQDENINELKTLCKKRRAKSTITLHNVIKHIDIRYVISECLEHVVLNFSSKKFGLLVESEQQWLFLLLLIKQRELEGFLFPVYKKEIVEKYFEYPIVSFLPASWVSELVILPPSEHLYFISPSTKSSIITRDTIFSAPNQSSIDISDEKIDVMTYKPISLDFTDEFYQQFIRENPKLIMPTDCDVNLLGKIYDSSDNLKVFDMINAKNDNFQVVIGKIYICISTNSEIDILSFENEYQMNNTAYIVDQIDASNTSEEDYRRARSLIMDVWKKALRDNYFKEPLEIKLKQLGAEKANDQNIRNWGDRTSIAPGSRKDFRAVLKYAGIKEESEIRSYFKIADSIRSESISLGHKKAELSQEIVKTFISLEIKNNSTFEENYNVHGIIIRIQKLRTKYA